VSRSGPTQPSEKVGAAEGVRKRLGTRTRNRSPKRPGARPGRERLAPADSREALKAAFLVAYTKWGNVTVGCRAAGIPRRSYYDWIAKDKAFANAVDAAREEVLDDLEEEMFKRARDKSDLLMIFTLKHNRDRYRETPRVEVAVKPSVLVEYRDAKAELLKRLDQLANRRDGVAELPRIAPPRHLDPLQGYEDAGFMFANSIGAPVDVRSLRRSSFHKILATARIPQLRMYDLRHTCASLMLANGTNAKVVSERLGHSTITLTMDTYSAVLPTMQEEATAKLERLVLSAG
jgi:hypothetical protein